MRRHILLLADNDPDFLHTRKEFLEGEGFRVIPAENPTQARRLLDKGGIDLAILDIRLIDDDDEKDRSGLTLATISEYSSIPKIILTDFPTVDAAREALRQQSNGYTSAVDFVSKADKNEELIVAIRRVIQNIESRRDMAQLLNDDYMRAQRRRDVTYYIELSLSVLGKVVVIVGAILVLYGKTTEGAFTSVAGAAIDGALWRFLDDANKRVVESREKLFSWHDRHSNKGDKA